MTQKEQTLKELGEKSGQLKSIQALVGLDGFVDKLMTPVDKRHGIGEHFEPIRTIEAFGKRISGAAGMSTNIEWYPKLEKLGGNGPIMANALLNGGLPVRYMGALGTPEIHPIFKAFAEKTNAVSVANPGVSHAAEFNDGKIIFGTTSTLEQVSYESILETMGEGAFLDAVSRADLIALTNWTMLPHMTDIYQNLVEKVLPNLGPKNHRCFFFDLADPQKRSDSDLLSALHTIKRFQNHGHVILGLNLKEAQQVDRLLENTPLDPDSDGLKTMARRICQTLSLGTVVVHPSDCAACANKQDAWYVQGPYCESPKVTTGAGDHFNAGFCTGMVLGLSPLASLLIAVSFSGYYVRTAKSPSMQEMEQFIRNDYS